MLSFISNAPASLKQAITSIENSNISLVAWTISLVGLVYIRAFLEDFSTRTETSIITTDVQTLLHYVLFYVCALLILILVLHFFTKKPILAVGNIALCGFGIILIAPIIDLIISSGKGGLEIAYLFTDKKGLVSNFITFFGSHSLPGVTPGIRFEFIALLLFVFTYTQQSTKSLVRSLSAVFVTYVSVFITIALPSFIALTGFDFQFFLYSIQGSFLETHFIHPTIIYKGLSRTFEMYFNGFMSLVLYLLLVVLVSVWSFRYNFKQTIAIWKNSRFDRLLTYWGVLSVGAIVGMTIYGIPNFTGLNILYLITLFLTVYFAWMFSVSTNDIVDLEIDKISNSKRPLITGEISVEAMKNFGFVFLLLSLIGGFISGHHVFSLILIFIFLYYLYSFPPLRIKRFVGLNAAVIGSCSLVITLIGFLTISGASGLNQVPFNWFILVFVGFFLISNAKDIKDAEGDKVEGINTLLVLFGEKNGKKIISFLVFAALSLVPVLTGIPFFWYYLPIFGYASHLAIHHNPYNERYLFILCISYIFIGISTFLVFI